MSQSDPPPPPAGAVPRVESSRREHPDADTIAVLALGEHSDDGVVAHLAACDACRGEVQSYARVVAAGFSAHPTDGWSAVGDSDLPAPPRYVWERVAADLGMDPALLPRSTDGAGATGQDASLHRLADRTRRQAAAGSTAGGRQRVSSRIGLLAAASVAGAIVGAGAVLGWQALDDPAVVASAVLAPLPDKAANGDVVLIGSGEERELNLRLDVDAPADAYLQVWLMSPDTQRMVPVGVLEDGVGFWRVPAGLDLAEFPVVDVSIEPFDGDSTHSADSLVRGTLSAA